MGEIGRDESDTKPDTGAGPITWSGFVPMLQRFLFFGWLFKDMTRTMNVFERHAAWAYNQAQRHWLPIYMRRWLVISAMFWGAGAYCDTALAATTLAQMCYLGMTGGVAVLMTLSVDWLFLARSDDQGMARHDGE